MQPIPQSTVETALVHAEKWPMTVGFFLAVALMGALAYWLLFKFWPAWLLEQEKHREHLAKALAQRGAEAQEDIAAATKLHESQQTTLVKELGGRIDKTHEKIGEVHAKVHAIATKIGVTVFAICLFGSGFAVGFALGNNAKPAALVESADRAKCNSPCANGFYCCGENKCCEVKTAPAASRRTSTLAFASFGGFAQPGCNYRREVCR
jgi:hypothetical protein